MYIHNNDIKIGCWYVTTGWTKDEDDGDDLTGWDLFHCKERRSQDFTGTPFQIMEIALPFIICEGIRENGDVIDVRVYKLQEVSRHYVEAYKRMYERSFIRSNN